MTDKEKQIEEMAQILCTKRNPICDNCVIKIKECDCYDKANALYNAGYRKMDEVTLRLDLGDCSAEEIKQIAEAFNSDIKKQVAKEILTALCEPMDVWTETEDLEKSEQRKIGGLLFVNKANERIKELAKKYEVEV